MGAAATNFDQLLVGWKVGALPRRFEKLERFREHTIDVLVGERGSPARVQELLKRALEIGHGTARILDFRNSVHIVSTEMSCPGCGQSFEELWIPGFFRSTRRTGGREECRGFGEVWAGPRVNPRLDSEIELEIDQERQSTEVLEDGEA